MTIKATVHGPFVSIEALDVLGVEDLPTLYDAFRAAHQKGPFVVLTDTLAMESAPRQVISAFADGIKKMPDVAKSWLGDAVVVKSPAVRFVLSTLLIVAPMPTEVKVFDARQPARRWCGDVLRKANIAVPAELLRSA
jgi:hypothetical protein